MIKLSLGKKRHVLLKPACADFEIRVERSSVSSGGSAKLCAAGALLLGNSKNLRSKPGATAEIGLTRSTGAAVGPTTS